MWNATWSPDGQLLAAVGADRCVYLYRLISTRSASSDSAAQSTDSSSPTADAVAPPSPVSKSTSIRYSLTLWQKLVDDEHHQRTIRSCAFSSCGRFFVTCSFDSNVVVWKRSSNDNSDDAAFEFLACLEGHENEVKCVSWHSHSPLLATCGNFPFYPLQ
jgi:WD40 repeat protein